MPLSSFRSNPCRSKPVLLAVIDALASRVVLPALQTGELPYFGRLAELGVLRAENSAIFPSITPAATASLVTGAYPQEHGVLGAYWYDRARDEVAYFGDDFWVIVNKGLSAFVQDFLVKLNFQFLDTPTIFQTLAQRGLTATCLNYLWFRGETEHATHPPWWLRLVPGLRGSKTIHGPDVLVLGDLLTSRLPNSGERLTSPGGLFHRFGFDDRSTGALLRRIAERREMTDFTPAYFPDNDFQSHRDGPHEAIASLKQSDSRVDQVIIQDMASSGPRPYEEAREVVHRVLTSDRGQLSFWAVSADSSDANTNRGDGFSARDVYGNLWQGRGDLATVDARITPDGTLEYGIYPNALERIAAACASNSGNLWATARLGHEFQFPPTTLHRRGSHGSLHRDDSTSPLIVAGHASDDLVPSHPRSVDVAPLCYALLGVASDDKQVVPMREAARCKRRIRCLRKPSRSRKTCTKLTRSGNKTTEVTWRLPCHSTWLCRSFRCC